MKKIGIVIVTYNRLQLLKEEIESIKRQTYKNFTIVVVNNSSTDGTKEWLEQQTDIFTITQENSGCSGGMFTGIKYVAENGYDLCWVMDDDVEYKDNTLEELVSAYELLGGNVGFLCSKVEGIHGEPMNVPAVDLRPSSNGYCNYYQYIDNQMIKVETATFVSLLFSTDMAREVGLPLRQFYIWGDDTEYTLRISRQHECYLCCKSIAVHKRSIQGALSFDTEMDKKRLSNYFYMFRNEAYVIRHYRGVKPYVKTYIAMILSFIHFFIRFNFTKSNVIMKALVNIPSFNPAIQYPLK